jgi:uncharacterized membrane protein
MGVNIPVRVGQVWSDNDHRAQGRTIKVVAIDPEHIVGNRYATVEVVTDRSDIVNPTVGQTRRVLLRRFIPTRQSGYTLVKDV